MTQAQSFPRAPQLPDASHAEGVLSRGRAALTADWSASPRSAESLDNLLELLWHPDENFALQSALTLAGGDSTRAYQPDYGYFAPAIRRRLRQAHNIPLPAGQPRLRAVSTVLREQLRHSSEEIGWMSGMRYSFLSAGVYLAVLATCRDALNAVRRLRVAPAHSEICFLLACLGNAEVRRRVSAQHVAMLAELAGQAIAVLPPAEAPEFWTLIRDAGTAPVVAQALEQISGSEATPFLLESLDGAAPGAQPLLAAALGRTGDAAALPSLARLRNGRCRRASSAARSAIQAIERAQISRPGAHLLRHAASQPDSPSLLRIVEFSHKTDRAELARSASPPAVGEDLR